MQNPRVKEYLKSKDFKDRKLPVDSAQCDSIVGFGNFTREVFDMDPNQCKNHLLGKLHCLFFLLILIFMLILVSFQLCRHCCG
jgi:hypothetical protein